MERNNDFNNLLLTDEYTSKTQANIRIRDVHNLF